MSLLVLIVVLLISCSNSSPVTPTPVPPPSLTPIIPTETQVPPTPMTGCVIKGDLRVRSEPNSSGNTLGELKNGVCVDVYGKNPDKTWVWISTEELTGWVSLEYLSINGDNKLLPTINENASIIETTSIPATIAHFTKATLPPPATPRKTNTPLSLPTQNVLSCGDADDYVGDFISCRINRAYCSYRPSVGGSPTFCNDAPYPNHDFTLLVWGSDWSDFDGKCIIVKGLVTIYQGKPQIEATNRSQVSNCD